MKLHLVAALGATLLAPACSDDSPTAAAPADAGGSAPSPDATAPADTPATDPVPPGALGPTVPPSGYLVQEVRDQLYWVTDGVYQSIFLATGQGVVVVDAPQTIAPNLIKAIRGVTSEPITHFIYSHHHADHVGGAGVLPPGTTYIAQKETADFLQRSADPNRPVPTVTFEESYTLTLGSQTLVLDYKGVNHDPGNIFIYMPRQRALMLVDVVFPGWVPFNYLAGTSDVPGYFQAHDQALGYDFDTFIGGHVGRLGTKADILVAKEYLADLKAAGASALQNYDPATVLRTVDAANPWAFGSKLLDAYSEKCASDVVPRWRGRLGGTDVFTKSHCFKVQESLRAD